MLPRGVDEYLERRQPAALRPIASRRRAASHGRNATDRRPPTPHRAKARAGSAEERAARKTVARLDKQLERIAAARGRAERRDRRARAGLREARRAQRPARRLAAEKDEARAGVAGGRRAPRVGAQETASSGERRRAACAAGWPAGSGPRPAGRRAAAARRPAAPRTRRRRCSVPSGGEPHEDAAPVVRVGEPLDEAAGGEPVDPVGHRAAGHQRLARAAARGRARTAPPARRSAASTSNSHDSIPWAVNACAAGQVEVAGQPADPAEHLDRARGRGRGARAPTPRPARRPRPAWHHA